MAKLHAIELFNPKYLWQSLKNDRNRIYYIVDITTVDEHAVQAPRNHLAWEKLHVTMASVWEWFKYHFLREQDSIDFVGNCCEMYLYHTDLLRFRFCDCLG